MLQRISHIYLAVQDQEKAKKWYEEHLQWKVCMDEQVHCAENEDACPTDGGKNAKSGDSCPTTGRSAKNENACPTTGAGGSDQGKTMRWLTMCPPKQPEIQVALVLHPPYSTMDDKKSDICRKMRWIFETDSCHDDIEKFRKAGVKIAMDPHKYDWGIHAVITDPFGNSFSVVEPNKKCPR